MRARLCAALLALGLALSASAEVGDFLGPPGSGVYGIRDRHFRGVLFPEAYKSLPSAHVAFPGLWAAERSSATVGFLPRLSGEAPSGGFRALYAHADIDISPGSAGVWVGNFGAVDSFRVFDYFDKATAWEVSEFSLRGAFWISPYQNELFRGVSAAFDVDNFYAYNGDDFDGLYDDKSYYLNINALVRLGGDYHMRVALSTRGVHAENPEDTRFDNRRLFADALSVGLLDAGLRSLELRVRNVFAVNNGDEKRDTVSLDLCYAGGGAYSYMRHTLFIGLKAEAGASYVSEINADAGSFRYMHYIEKLTGAGRVLRAGASAPIVVDVGLVGGLRGMISISPSVSYTHIAPGGGSSGSPLHLNPQSAFAMGLSDAELSLRGGVGDRFDLTVTPSIRSDVFFSALEVRYRF